jgi:adenylate cyclase
MPAVRRLAAILAADVAGYSRLIGADEQGTLARLKGIRGELIDPAIAVHGGRIVKTTGDGLLAEFGSTVDALRCAQEIQAGLRQQNVELAPGNRIEFRIGIHQGDIVVAQIVGNGVREILLFGIGRQTGERQYDDRQARHRCSHRSAAWRDRRHVDRVGAYRTRDIF